MLVLWGHQSGGMSGCFDGHVGLLLGGCMRFYPLCLAGGAGFYGSIQDRQQCKYSKAKQGYEDLWGENGFGIELTTRVKNTPQTCSDTGIHKCSGDDAQRRPQD